MNINQCFTCGNYYTTEPCCTPTQRTQKAESAVLRVVDVPTVTTAENEVRAMSKRKTKQPHKKVTIDGIVFDSNTEANRYRILKQAQSVGAITDLVCHPKYTISPRKVLKPARPFRAKSATVGAITYTPDFRYTWQGLTVVEDAKGITSKRGKNGTYYRPLMTASARKSHKMLQVQHPDIVFIISTPVATMRDKLATGATWWQWYSASNYVSCQIEKVLEETEPTPLQVLPKSQPPRALHIYNNGKPSAKAYPVIGAGVLNDKDFVVLDIGTGAPMHYSVFVDDVRLRGQWGEDVKAKAA